MTLLPVASTLLITWLVAAPLLWFLRTRLRALSKSAAVAGSV